MEMTITKQDIEQIIDFIERGSLVQLMNDRGMSISAMSLVLTAIDGACIEIMKKMDEEELPA